MRLENTLHAINQENQELREGIDSKNLQIDEMVLKYGNSINCQFSCRRIG
jgi:hypothetical protein